ncbi:DMT family transporter [Alkalicoccobacillus murimartini]|uniref:Paired small multidrug resistance pump n=1 Tax=Alkalicoccobacillus murimartini TaxID=171685 RepID=A0ABT9YGN1_9BACI|nr:multidrug efflux SMR transporter [Alkalicoccobacillus murimartini]MDQ0207021.1 paired small multidrug resistance pump [Alkalicoccobacillus murimartini]
MAWMSVIFAGFCELFGVTMMNQLRTKKGPGPYIGLIAGFASSFILLSYAMNSLPMGTVYAVWTGIGAFGGAIVGMIFYGESRDPKRLFFIGLILVSVIGLKSIS